MCFSIPPEGGALSSASVPEQGAGPGENDSALNRFSKLNSGSLGA